MSTAADSNNTLEVQDNKVIAESLPNDPNVPDQTPVESILVDEDKEKTASNPQEDATLGKRIDPNSVTTEDKELVQETAASGEKIVPEENTTSKPIEEVQDSIPEPNPMVVAQNLESQVAAQEEGNPSGVDSAQPATEDNPQTTHDEQVQDAVANTSHAIPEVSLANEIQPGVTETADDEKVEQEAKTDAEEEKPLAA